MSSDVKSLRLTESKKRKKSKEKTSKRAKSKVKVSRVLKGKSEKYKVPKKKFQKALEMINNGSLWGDEPKHLKYCSMANKSFENSRNTMINLLIEARKCLLRRDWANLAKILTIAKPSCSYEISHFYHLFMKYAAICLAHNRDLNLMGAFMEGVVSSCVKG